MAITMVVNAYIIDGMSHRDQVFTCEQMAMSMHMPAALNVMVLDKP